MKYYVIKVIYEKFTYYLDEFDNWQGLQNNGKIYTSYIEMNVKENKMKRFCKNNEELKHIVVE